MNEHNERVAEAVEFLTTIFHVSTPGEIIVKAGKRAPGRPYRTIDGAAKAAIRMSQKNRGDVFFGLGRNITDSHRQEGVLELTTCWADIDVEQDTDAAREKILDALEQTLPGAPPNVCVKTASGFHVYWTLDTPTDPRVVEFLNVALCEKYGGDPRMAAGAHAVLRVPGTNVYETGRAKYVPPRRVSLEWCEDAPYSVEDLARVLGLGSPALRASQRVPRMQYPPVPGLLDEVEARMDKSQRSRTGPDKVSGRCFFPSRHSKGDVDPSAVVFGSGWYHCSGCGLNEKPRSWMQRPEVSTWAKKYIKLLPRVRSGPPDDAVYAARIAFKNVNTMLLRFGDTKWMKEQPDRWEVPENAEERGEFKDPDWYRLCLRDEGGPHLLRTFWCCLYFAFLAQDRGRFRCSVSDVALALGFDAGRDGRVASGTRRSISRALEALVRTPLKLKLSKSHPAEYPPDGLVSRIGETGRTRTYRTHTAIWKQMEWGPARAPWNPAALKLRDEEALGFYLRATWEMDDRDNEERAKPWSTGLHGFLDRAGVLNRPEQKRRKRFISDWKKRFEEMVRLRLFEDLSLETKVRPGETWVTITPVQPNSGVGDDEKEIIRDPAHRAQLTVPQVPPLDGSQDR